MLKAVSSDDAAEERVGSLHALLAERLRDMIVEGQLAPGTRIPEAKLCEQFSVSRTPLREALKVLAAEGLVELLPNRGSRVPCVTLENLGEVFAVASVLEGLAGELAAVRSTDEQLDQIARLQDEMVAAYKARNRQEYFHLNQAIHSAIMAASGSQALSDAYRPIAGRIMASRYKANVSEERWTAAVQEHEAILRLLQLRRPVECGQLLRAHIMNKYQSICQAAQSAQAGSSAG